MPKLCICDICTCGRHRCPHTGNNFMKGAQGPCNLTEYNNVYQPKQIPPRVSFKPANQPMQGGEFMDSTTQRADFREHPLDKPYVHKPEPYVQPQGEMENRTSYKAEYTEKQGPRAVAIRHDGQRQVQAKFEGEPTYKRDYRQWDAQRTQPIVNQAAWAPPKAPFEGQSTSQRDYREKEIQRRMNFKPVDTAKPSDAPFAESTAHRDAYVQHPLEKPFVRAREEYKPPAAKLEGLTTFRRDYQGAYGGPTHSFKPEGRPFQSDAPFEDGTTNRHDFKRWPMERPYVHPHDVYRQPQGEMDLSTTHKATFKEMPIERVMAKRPHSAKKTNAPFDGTTNYSMDFRGYRGDRAAMPKGPEYVPNQAPFEGHSTYKGHYIKHSQPPPQPFRPSQAPLHSDARFDDWTNYRTDFTPKPIHVCEAAMLEQPKSKFRFTELDNRGHKMYQPVSTTVTPLHSGGMQQNRGPMALSVA